MNKLLQDNPIGIVLAGACVFLVLCMAIIAVWSSFSPGSGFEPGNESTGAVFAELPSLAENPPVESFSVITQRPLFNESRLPVIELEVAADDSVEEILDADETELDVELSGIVITPTLRMATLKRKDGANSLVALEGKYLEGEFGSWQLSMVSSRKVTLISSSGKELELELQVHDERIEPPEPAVEQETPEALAAAELQAEQKDGQPLTRAEEIRQRIAERREELRMQAEEDQAGEEAAEPSYQDAIRAMINRRPAPEKASETENEK